MLNFKGFEILPFAEVQTTGQYLIVEAGWLAISDKESDSDLLGSHRFQLFTIPYGADEVPKKQFDELFVRCFTEVTEFSNSACCDLTNTQIITLAHELVSVVAKKLTALSKTLSTKFSW